MSDFEPDTVRYYVQSHGFDLCHSRNTPFEWFLRCLALFVACFFVREAFLGLIKK